MSIIVTVLLVLPENEERDVLDFLETLDKSRKFPNAPMYLMGFHKEDEETVKEVVDVG